MPYKPYQTPPKRTTRRSCADAASSAESQEPESAEVEIKQDQEEKMEEMVEEEVTETVDVKEENGNTDDQTKKRPWPQRLKDGGVKKLPKDVLKRRRNFRLKKMVVPKAPVMILHELVGAVQYELSEPIPPPPTVKNMPTLYLAKVLHEGVEFHGKGPSKSIAKNLAAEQVLQFITTQSCSSDSQDTEAGPNLETETPWSALASLAMFKLFNDWQAQGYLLPPELAKGVGTSLAGPPSQGEEGEKPQRPKKEKAEKEKAEKALPENHMDKHPVQLLNEMKGPLEYQETGCEGQPPNCVFTLSVSIQQLTFSGQGRSKKEAKRAAAQAALKAFYNIEFTS